jgi:hypothetical protein
MPLAGYASNLNSDTGRCALFFTDLFFLRLQPQANLAPSADGVPVYSGGVGSVVDWREFDPAACVRVCACVWAGACLRLVTISDAAAGVLFHYVSWLVGQDGPIQAVADVQAAGGMGARHGTLLTRAVPTARAVLRRALRSVPGTVAHSRLALRLAPTWRSRVVAACMSQVSHPPCPSV